MNKIFIFLRLIYRKLFYINDTPQKIALGFGLGVCLGIIPSTGPLAALLVSSILRVNRASALLGSLLTNTWLSIATFLLSIKIGSAIIKVDYLQVYRQWQLCLTCKSWFNLFSFPVIKLALPVILGYFIIAFSLGFLAYLLTLCIITILRDEKNKSRADLSR
ncbi:DUF2062 domain-containing protein [bacterium]|nr:MAG: DUF2062 domain-containing protein [bacterium]